MCLFPAAMDQAPMKMHLLSKRPRHNCVNTGKKYR
jgi:hypothetical protein